MPCIADILTFPAGRFIPHSAAVVTSHKCTHGRENVGARLSIFFGTGCPFIVMKNSLRERSDSERQRERERESDGCGRAELKACDTSYLGNGSSLCWGVAPFFLLPWWPPPLRKKVSSERFS